MSIPAPIPIQMARLRRTVSGTIIMGDEIIKKLTKKLSSKPPPPNKE